MKENKAGYTAIEVACRWAGAIFEVTRPFGQEQYRKNRSEIRNVTDGPTHCGLYCALGGSLGINVTPFSLHCSLLNIQSEKHFSAYFQML